MSATEKDMVRDMRLVTGDVCERYRVYANRSVPCKGRPFPDHRWKDYAELCHPLPAWA